MTSHAEHINHLVAVICAGRERPCTLAAGHIGPHIDRPAPWLDHSGTDHERRFRGVYKDETGRWITKDGFEAYVAEPGSISWAGELDTECRCLTMDRKVHPIGIPGCAFTIESNPDRCDCGRIHEPTPSIDADYPPAPVVDSPLFPDRLTLVDWSMIQLALEQRAQRFADIGVPETSILYTKLAGRVRRGVR